MKPIEFKFPLKIIRHTWAGYGCDYTLVDASGYLLSWVSFQLEESKVKRRILADRLRGMRALKYNLEKLKADSERLHRIEENIEKQKRAKDGEVYVLLDEIGLNPQKGGSDDQ